ncbi:MAG: choice-of-anchor D domain-containing protein [Acidobacteriia bacterium]|nr:choice-of-anchor D domain-containing protein [Terriglobia bacterium]
MANRSVNGQTPVWFTEDAAGNFKTVTVPAPYTLLGIYGMNDSGALSASLQVGSPGNYSFAIINPDGSVTLVPGQTDGLQFYLGSLNNSGQILEIRGTTHLADASGNDADTTIPFARGLNNAATVVGYGFGGDGYSWDPTSGVKSRMLCLGGNAIVQGINDSGVVVGGWHIMTPLPGEPQIILSTTNLTFAPTPVGQTSAPQTVVVTNSGNARLDIAQIDAAGNGFAISGCLDPTTHTASLDPGANCTLSVTATPRATGAQSGTFTFWDSAPGSPGIIAVSVTGTAPPPACSLSSISKGPPAQANFTMQDTNSGLKSITLVDSTNATVNIPNFVQGATVPIHVTATQSDTAQTSQVDFQVTNMAGAATTCGTTFASSSTWNDLDGSITGKITRFFDGNDLAEVFARGSDNSLWHISQTSQGGSWSAWENLGGTLASDPAMADPNTGDGFVPAEVFAVFNDGALWHIKTTGPGTWSSWSSLGGSLLGDVSVGTNKDGRLEVFGVGSDHALWHIAQTSAGGGWGDWSSLGGQIISDPTVVTNAPTGTLAGCLEVFVVGGDQAVWHNFQTTPGGSWSGWQSLGGGMTGNLAAGRNNDGRLEVLARGTDNALWDLPETAPGGPWSSWVSLNGVISSDPSVALNTDGRMEAFVRGGDSALWHIPQVSAGGSWGQWSSLGGVLANGPTAGGINIGTLAVFIEGYYDTSLWYIQQIAPGSWN